VPGAWHNIREGLQHNRAQVIRYYRHTPIAFRSNHLVSQADTEP
jgi:hypothetical protein